MPFLFPRLAPAVGLSLILLGIVPGAQALDFMKHPSVREFSDGLAERHGFSANHLKQVFRCATHRPEIIEAMERPKELLPWHEYRKIFVTEDSVKRGLQFWNSHEAVLARAAERYGVSPEFVVAILGVETRYGRNQGSYPILDALATLSFDYPPRAAYFRSELEEYLLLTRESDLDACALKGSYAGAMGQPQFMPSNYRRLAVDFDGDGKRDLLESTADAIGSVAHYLQRHGWEAGAPVIEEARLEGTRYFWIEKLGLKPALSVRQLAGYGVFPRLRDDPERRAALISLEGELGPIHWLGYQNFYVITRYNRSKRYAMAVVELGERIRRLKQEQPSS